MKKILFTALIFFLPLVAAAENVDSFRSDITVGKDGAFSVVETIQYDFGEEDRHGIFRYLPTKHGEESSHWFKERYIEVEVLSVTLDGQTTPYEVTENLGELEVKIGDPDLTITGEHVYVITYRVSGALYYYDQSAVDLYWNVTGNGWTVPMESVSARIYDPEKVTTTEASCYVGQSGDTTECPVEMGDPIVMGGVALAPGEGLTIAQSLDSSLVNTLVLERWSVWPLWLVFAVGWLVWLISFLWRYAREYKTGASIIAQYEPYGNLKPMYTGVLFDGQVDQRDITAGIVHLAEQGFFKIRHVGRKVFFIIEVDDYEIILEKPYSLLQTEFQRVLFKLMFDETAAVGDRVVLSALAKDASKRFKNQALLVELRKAAEADLIKDGFFRNEWRMPGKLVGYLFLILTASFLVTFLLGADIVVPLVVSIILLVITLISVLFVYRRRTRQGYEALDHLKGFKEFLSVTDKERFKFHNAPQKSPEQFMAFLPYAIAFGVEKEWAKAFKDITLPTPDWYEGNGAAFNAVYLSQSLGTFGGSMSSASGTASSGGGSSGGGAGGGGGGSW